MNTPARHRAPPMRGVVFLAMAGVLCSLTASPFPCRGDTAPPVAAPTPHVFVIAPSERDDAAAVRLEVLLGMPITRLAGDADPAQVVTTQRDAVVIVLDSARARVTRYRPGEPEPLVRDLGDPPGGPSAYQLAFVAAELLPLVVLAPPSATRPDDALRRTRPVWLRLAFGLSNPYAGLSPFTEGGFAVGAWRVARNPRVAFEAELEGRYGATASEQLDAGRLALRRGQLRLRGGVLWRAGASSVGLGPEASVRVIRAVFGGEGAVRRTSVSLGLRGELRARLAPHLDVFAACGIALAGARHDFRVEGVSVARERRYVVEGGLGLLVRFGGE